VLDTNQYEGGLRLNQLKNHIVHPTGVAIVPEELQSAFENVLALTEILFDADERRVA